MSVSRDHDYNGKQLNSLMILTVEPDTHCRRSIWPYHILHRSAEMEESCPGDHSRGILQGEL